MNKIQMFKIAIFAWTGI